MNGLVKGVFPALVGVFLTGVFPRPAAGDVRLAVPAFENLTGEPRLDWIGEGFGRTLVEKLNLVAELSAAPLKARGLGTTGREIDLRSLLDSGALSADSLVFGAVVKGADVDHLDDPLAITVRIVDAASTKQLHALEIAGTMRQLFAIEADLAAKVARLLGATLSPAEEEALRTQETRSLEAYKETVLGTIFMEDGKYEPAIAMFEEAMRHHPGIFFPKAHNLLAQAYLLSGKKREMLERFKKDAAVLSEVYYHLGEALEYTGDTAQAALNFGLFLRYTDRRTLLWRRKVPGENIFQVDESRVWLRDPATLRLRKLTLETGEDIALAPGEKSPGAAQEQPPRMTGKLIPEEERRQITTSILVAEDRVYYGLKNGYLLGRSVKDGARVWAYRTLGRPARLLAAAAGTLLAADDLGTVYRLSLHEGAGPTDVGAYLKLAGLAVRQGHSVDAAEIYRHIVDEVKFNVPEAWHGLWELAQAEGNQDSVERYWKNYREAQY